MNNLKMLSALIYMNRVGTDSGGGRCLLKGGDMGGGRNDPKGGTDGGGKRIESGDGSGGGKRPAGEIC